MGAAAIDERGSTHLAEVRYLDYRDVPETGFDAVSSIGLTEHIGVRNYPPTSASSATSCARGPAAQPLHHPARQPRPPRPGAFIDRYVFPTAS